MKFISIAFFLISCQNSDLSTTKKFIPNMYEESEMALFMRCIYEENSKMKKGIITGTPSNRFPSYFLNIFNSKLTNDKPYSENLITYSKVYIDNVRTLFDTVSPISLKTRYNNSINTCIACHTSECAGPIPSIKKLLIK